MDMSVDYGGHGMILGHDGPSPDAPAPAGRVLGPISDVIQALHKPAATYWRSMPSAHACIGVGAPINIRPANYLHDFSPVCEP